MFQVSQGISLGITEGAVMLMCVSDLVLEYPSLRPPLFARYEEQMAPELSPHLDAKSKIVILLSSGDHNNISVVPSF